ncbi:hypothetical protein [Citrobacter braakii]|uniref:Uncharacterized protein n=1 Tax=Citrobacter braakii TaxID=57706 RepID=A0A1V8NRL7_CITBR|nr:hypothetical protein [Citrobacter braakii]OQM39053.1 hypothetical protein BZK42_26935 [Citrobacter braakii]QXC16776.1 hypothetical protein I6L51_01265 [Citrobacter braakii]
MTVKRRPYGMQPAFFNHPGPDVPFPGNALMVSSSSTLARTVPPLRCPVSGLYVSPALTTHAFSDR